MLSFMAYQACNSPGQMEPKALYTTPHPDIPHIPIEINHTTVILMNAVARELYWLAWIGFLMAI